VDYVHEHACARAARMPSRAHMKKQPARAHEQCAQRHSASSTCMFGAQPTSRLGDPLHQPLEGHCCKHVCNLRGCAGNQPSSGHRLRGAAPGAWAFDGPSGLTQPFLHPCSASIAHADVSSERRAPRPPRTGAPPSPSPASHQSTGFTKHSITSGWRRTPHLHLIKAQDLHIRPVYVHRVGGGSAAAAAAATRTAAAAAATRTAAAAPPAHTAGAGGLLEVRQVCIVQQAGSSQGHASAVGGSEDLRADAALARHAVCVCVCACVCMSVHVCVHACACVSAAAGGEQVSGCVAAVRAAAAAAVVVPPARLCAHLRYLRMAMTARFADFCCSTCNT